MVQRRNLCILFAAMMTITFFSIGCNEEKNKISDKKTGEIMEKKQEPLLEEPVEVKQEKQQPVAKIVKLETTKGNITIELDEEKAPVTVKNFLSYVEDGFYDGLIFHRVISNFMIQGGGFTVEMAQGKTRDPIVNEANNGLKNERGTIAMARTNDPNSATAQFFINHKDNEFLDYAGEANPGYAVFGKTVEGLDVVDAIAMVETTTQKGMADVPVEPVVITSAVLK